MQGPWAGPVFLFAELSLARALSPVSCSFQPGHGHSHECTHLRRRGKACSKSWGSGAGARPALCPLLLWVVGSGVGPITWADHFSELGPPQACQKSGGEGGLPGGRGGLLPGRCRSCVPDIVTWAGRQDLDVMLSSVPRG